MAQELVWARVGDVRTAVSRGYAEAKGLEVFADEPVRTADGSLRALERANGRPAKKKTTVAEKAAEKKAAEVIASEPASDTENKESSR